MKRRALLGLGGLAVASLLAPLMARSLAPVERIYTVDLTGNTTLKLGAAPQQIRFRIQGTFRTTEAADQKVIGQLERPQIRLWQNDEARLTESKALEVGLNAPFVIQKSADGNIATVAFSPESPDSARQTLRAMLTFFQASGKRPNRETDLAGPCEVSYQAVPNGKWEKKVVRYIATPDALTEQHPEGTQIVIFDTAGGIKTISGSRTVRTLLGDRELSVSTLSGSIRQSEQAPLLKSVALPPVGKPEPLNAGSDPKEQERQRYASTLGDSTPTSLLSALEKLPADAPNSLSNPLYLKLRALIALQPDSATQFTTYLAQAQSDSAGAHALLDAIREIGTPQAQRVLGTAIKSRLSDSSFVERAMPALALVTNPSKETEQFLLELSRRTDSIGEQASLLLGTLIHSLNSTEPARSNALLGELTTRLKASTSESNIQLILAALGNSGVPEAMPLIVPSLSHTSPTLRAAAASALRLIPGQQAEAQLLNLLKSDTESSVRATAAFALSFQPRPQSVKDALNKALTDPSKEVVESVKRALAALPEKAN